jgi:Ca-activated chloride channel family protein
VEASVQLPDIFQTELNGLMATTGRDLGLTIEPAQGSIGCELLNDLPRPPSGRFQLPNLVIGMPISIVVRLTVPPQQHAGELCRFHFDWDEVGDSSRGRRSRTAVLALPVVSAHNWSQMPIDPAVAEQETLMKAADARKEVLAALDRGDKTGARHWLGRIRQLLTGAPTTAETTAEWDSLHKTEEHLILGDLGSARKVAHYQHYQRKSGRGTT